MNKQSKIVLFISFMIMTIFLSIFIWEYNKKYQQLKNQYDILNTQYNLQKDKVDEISEFRKKYQDSISNIIAEREKIIKDSENLIEEIEKKIKDIKRKKISVPKDIPGLVDYFNTRYSTEENVVIEDKVGLTKDIAYNVSYELEDKDNITVISSLKDQQIEVKDSIIHHLDGTNKDLFSMLNLAEKEIDERKILENISEENIKNLNNQIRNLNRKNNINKVLIPVGAVVGGFIGYKIAK